MRTESGVMCHLKYTLPKCMVTPLCWFDYTHKKLKSNKEQDDAEKGKENDQNGKRIMGKSCEHEWIEEYVEE